jgi:hypothetical protein
MTDSKSLVKQSIETAAERYSDNVALRAAITAIPWAGSPFDAIFTTLAARAANQRIATLISSLQEQFASVREEAVNKRYLESEAYMDAVLRAFEVSARTREAEKIRLYARILVGAACDETPGAPPPEALLSTLAELSPNEIVLARLIGNMPGSIRIDTDKARQPHRIVTQPAWEQVLEQVPTGTRANLMFHLKGGAHRSNCGAYWFFPQLHGRHLRAYSNALSHPRLFE